MILKANAGWHHLQVAQLPARVSESIPAACVRSMSVFKEQHLMNTGLHLTFPGNKQNVREKAKCSLVPRASLVTECCTTFDGPME